MALDRPFQVGDVLRYKDWPAGAPRYKVVALTTSGNLYAQTQEQRPMTRLIKPDEIAKFEKVQDAHAEP